MKRLKILLNILLLVTVTGCRQPRRLSEAELRGLLEQLHANDSHAILEAWLWSDATTELVLSDSLSLPGDTVTAPAGQSAPGEYDIRTPAAASMGYAGWGHWVQSILKDQPRTSFATAHLDGGRALHVAIMPRRSASPSLLAALSTSDTEARALHRLDRFLQRNQAIPAAWLEPSAIGRCLNSLATIAGVHRMIALDRNSLTEVGGFVTMIDPEGSQPVLRFFPVASAHLELTSAISAARHDTDESLALIREHQNKFLLVRDQLAVFLREIEGYTGMARVKRTDMFVDLYLTMARLSYLPSRPLFYRRIADEAPEGYYVGYFHVHPDDNPPSFADRTASLFTRNLVITPTSGGFQIHFLYYGFGLDRTIHTFAHEDAGTPLEGEGSPTGLPFSGV
ncbi:hypothetical protein JW905_11220 [bacterium]|nr:hypothetical protein [candidate division CSSED10-310 bacterium]